jgi:hypothetical protein
MLTQQAKRRWGKSEEARLAWLRVALRKRGARLVLEHLGTRGHRYVIEPGNTRVADTEAQALIRRKYVRALDRGLFSDQPQTWTAN